MKKLQMSLVLFFSMIVISGVHADEAIEKERKRWGCSASCDMNQNATMSECGKDKQPFGNCGCCNEIQ